MTNDSTNINQNNNFIISPLNYLGGKHKLLNQIYPLLPTTEYFIDLFVGGGNVGINANAQKIIFNDTNKQLIDLFNLFKHTSIESLLLKISHIIEKYNLSNTTHYGYEYYQCNSSSGLANFNKENFLKLRQDYNQTKDSLLLYVLIIFTFNNQMRFNQKGEFNLPVGKRDFNIKMREKLITFSETLKQKDIQFYTQDFRQFSLDSLSKDSLIYCDPPYLITLATYNENGGWHENDELDLLNFLDNIHQQGMKFALSNVIEAKNQENIILKQWLEKNNYTCHFLNKSYANSNYQRKDKQSLSIEVLITNY